MTIARPVGPGPILFGLLAIVGSGLAGVLLGPAALAPSDVLAALADRLPGVDVPTALTPRQLGIVWDLRLPRVVMGALVGATLAISGAAYQGVFRNPLVDPYLLGVAAGAGLGATLVFAGVGAPAELVPIAAFAGAVAAVFLTYMVGNRLGQRTSATLVLAGVAVASFLTAAQTYVQQRSAGDLRVVYTWILGRLSTGWSDVTLILPYVLVSGFAILLHRRLLDVLAVGEAEAETLGLPVSRVRLIVVVAATLGTAAAVAVSGLIGFVGIVVPHTVRLLAGNSYRSVLPLSLLFGGAFMIATDLAARTLVAPAELPIGVVTAFFGAPFFLTLLRRRPIYG